jgi:hypothetical protein
MSSSDPLEMCKRRRRTEVDRYYQTVLLTLGLKEFLDNQKTGCRFVSVEPKFREAKSDKEIFPDIVLQYDEDRYGILCEIKTSLPPVDHFLLEELKQLQTYSGQIEGWDTKSKKVHDHSVVLLCHALDSDRIVEKIADWTKDGQLKVSKKLCVVEWSVVESLKFDQRDTFLVRRKFGETGCADLDTKLQQNIRFDVDHLVIQYEECRFTRKQPPVEYTMDQLWSCVFPAIHEKSEDFTCTLADLLKVTHDYFIRWSGLQGEYSQVRKNWIDKAMQAFCDIELAQKIQDTFKVSYGRRIQKNVGEYFIEGLCRKRIEEARKIPIAEALDEAQRRMAEFG